MMSEALLRNILENYVYLRYENKSYSEFLKQRHGISMSLSMLKRRLQDYSLRRREVDDVENFILQEHHPGGNFGTWYSSGI